MIKSPLYQQLYDYIHAEIQHGNLKPGDRVPSEKDLAAQFNVSRITSKKALEMLFDDALIERIQGKGSFVTEQPAGSPANSSTGKAANSTSGKPLTQMVGLVLPDISDVYGLRLLRAIEMAISANGLFCVLKMTHGRQQEEEHAIRALLEMGVDGLIVFPVHGEYYNPELLRVVLGNFPLVLVDRHLRGIPAPAVHTDNVRAARQLTDYLLDHDHQHIAFASPPAEHTSTIKERLRGFREALDQRGLDVSRQLTTLYSTMPQASGADQIRTDENVIRRFLERHTEVTAFVASEYNIALLLERVMRQMDIKREIVCFDAPNPHYEPVRFTHIRQDEEVMGQTAVRLLSSQLAGQRNPEINLIDFIFVTLGSGYPVEIAQPMPHPIPHQIP